MELFFLMESPKGAELARIVDFILRAKEEIDPLDPRLRIFEEGNFETFYSPFEFINVSARITIIGLTPGQAQMRIALRHTQQALANGSPWHEAIEQAKYFASFGGPMRANLTKMLDHIGLQTWLGISSCALLFSSSSALAHHTSVLRYPVLKDRQNYGGQPSIDRVPFLRAQADRWFARELAQLPSSIFVPLGTQVQQAFARIARDQKISDDRCFFGIPHPSGANAERIAYFLGAKTKERLSRQTDGDSIDLVRNELLSKVQTLRSKL